MPTLLFQKEGIPLVLKSERYSHLENQTKIQALQQELNIKNLELKQFKQQVEDLQVLVNLMESRR